jgi:hypothetical protein
MIYHALLVLALHSWPGRFACKEAQKYDLCYTAQAILIEESSVCRYRYGDDGKSLGCMQISLAATRRIFPTFPRSAWQRLATEDAFNISIGVSYLHWCMVQMGSWARGVICYNAGPTFARKLSTQKVYEFPYLVAIVGYIKALERLEPGKR